MNACPGLESDLKPIALTLVLFGIQMAHQQRANQGGAVAMDDDFSDRMTRQQAEQARRNFEFPGWVCLGLMDMTASEGGWGLIIAPIGEIDDFSVYLSWRLWIQESATSQLSHAGSLRKPEMRKLARELCQAGGQNGAITSDPLLEMEA